MLTIGIKNKKNIIVPYSESKLENISEQDLYGKDIHIFDEEGKEISTLYRSIPNIGINDKYLFEVRWYKQIKHFNSIRACLYFYLGLIKRHDFIIVYVVDLEKATREILWSKEKEKLFKNTVTGEEYYFIDLYLTSIEEQFSKIVSISEPWRILWDIEPEGYKNNKGYLITDTNHNVIMGNQFLCGCFEKITRHDDPKRKSYPDNLLVKAVSTAQIRTIGKIYLDVINNYLDIYCK